MECLLLPSSLVAQEGDGPTREAPFDPTDLYGVSQLKSGRSNVNPFFAVFSVGVSVVFFLFFFFFFLFFFCLLFLFFCFFFFPVGFSVVFCCFWVAWTMPG